MNKQDHRRDVFSIALIGHRSLPADYGGVEVYTEEVGSRLASRGHRVVSYAELKNPGTHLYRGIELRPARCVTGKHLRSLSRSIASSWSTTREPFDVVHYQAMGPTLGAWLPRFVGRTAVVATIQGRDDQRRKWSMPARALMKLSYLSASMLPHEIVGVSTELVDDFARWSNDRVRWLPNGVDIEDLARPRPAPGIADPYVLYAGRLVPEKRPHDLITAFKRLPGTTRLLIAGGESGASGYVSSLRSLAGSDARIEFLGHRPREEIVGLMAHSVAFVLPSELEGLPLALLEALAVGAPVIVSDLGCHHDVLGAGAPGAELVEVGDVHGLGAAIQRAIEMQPQQATTSRQHRRELVHPFSWDLIVDELELIYSDAVARRRGIGPKPLRRSPLSLTG